MNFVNSISLTYLRNSEYFELITDLKNGITGIFPESRVTTDLVTQFNAVYSELDEATRVDRGSVLTEKVQEADEERGRTWRAMDLMVDAHLHSPVPEEVESAKIIRRIFDVYGDFRKRSFDSESSEARNLIQDMETPPNTEHVTRIRLNTWLPLYKSQQENFKTLQNTRDTERAYKSSGDVKAVREKMSPLYREITDLVNSYVRVGMATPEIENFIVVMNQKIKRYNDTLAARDGRKDSGADDDNNDNTD
ncbi:DUF6261 family protein [Draconibacterium sediminis]|uniref:DUF6261 family protein n=1 Tax=Draconibacterium sediminis TaxID=1544798 RepID=UPI0026F08FB1|nr:DUF6261 family protein [Draconibacterium sediminis]